MTTRELVWGGPVWGHPGCDAVLVEHGLVARVGQAEEFGDTEVRRICTQGGSILPGFVDGHTHLVETGLAESGFGVDLAGLDRGEALARQ